MQQKDTTDHLMALVQQYPTGWEEYVCPACGRRFIIRWPPERSKIILVEGNPNIDHVYLIETEEDKERLKPFMGFLQDRVDDSIT